MGDAEEIPQRVNLANLRMLEDDDTDIPILCNVGDNAKFVFLNMSGLTLYLDVASRTLRKVHGRAEDNRLSGVYPFMMIWPPTFPVLKDDPARNAM